MTALKDYKEMVWDPWMGWLKIHWKFYTVICAVSCAVGFLWGWFVMHPINRLSREDDYEEEDY